MQSHTHYKKVCKLCGIVMAQCRCMSKDKVIIYDECDECKAKAAKLFDEQQEIIKDQDQENAQKTYSIETTKRASDHIEKFYGINRISEEIDKMQEKTGKKPSNIIFGENDSVSKELLKLEYIFGIKIQYSSLVVFDLNSSKNLFVLSY